MQGVVYDAPALKKLNGGSARGRKLKDPVAHVIFSFHKSELHPQLYRLDPEHYNEQILGTVESGLAVLRLEKNQAVLAVHTDRDHIHVHVAVNRVDPETGRAAELTQSQNRLSAWAEQYETRHDNIVTPNRIARREARNAPTTIRWNGTRAPRRLPPMQRVRGAGRRDRTRRECGEWSRQYGRERREKAPRPVVGQQRRELRQAQSGRRNSAIRQMVGRLTGRTEAPTHDQRPIRRPGPSTPGPQRHAPPLQATRPRPAPPAEKVETAAERIDRYEREERRREFERWRREDEVRERIARWREDVSSPSLTAVFLSYLESAVYA
ncbi:MAG: relaxase/mobilization nuclease domain-containing protein, partial [Acidobacteria bacterium]|nr:relaxase/mobilization nuclease domain-containing protein [Acidobacteriota bacterium]